MGEKCIVRGIKICKTIHKRGRQPNDQFVLEISRLIFVKIGKLFKLVKKKIVFYIFLYRKQFSFPLFILSLFLFLRVKIKIPIFSDVFLNFSYMGFSFF
jgi:hypothetical protein